MSQGKIACTLKHMPGHNYIDCLYLSMFGYTLFTSLASHQVNHCGRVAGTDHIASLKSGTHVSGLGKSRTTSAVAWYAHTPGSASSICGSSFICYFGQ